MSEVTHTVTVRDGCEIILSLEIEGLGGSMWLLSLDECEALVANMQFQIEMVKGKHELDRMRLAAKEQP